MQTQQSFTLPLRPACPAAHPPSHYYSVPAIAVTAWTAVPARREEWGERVVVMLVVLLLMVLSWGGRWGKGLGYSLVVVAVQPD